MFVERARAVNPDFSPADDIEAVTEICQQLDGIALGIELAAARMVSMGPGEVLERLTDRFRFRTTRVKRGAGRANWKWTRGGARPREAIIPP